MCGAMGMRDLEPAAAVHGVLTPHSQLVGARRGGCAVQAVLQLTADWSRSFRALRKVVTDAQVRARWPHWCSPRWQGCGSCQ